MGKVTVENKKGKITIINRLAYPETVNERVYNDIASGKIEGFLPILIRKKRKETRIECVVQGMIPLEQYFGGVVTKRMFLDAVREIALLIKNCEKNMVNANNLELQCDKIFVDPQTKRVMCIFWPVVNNQRYNPPHLFLKQIPQNLKFAQHESSAYIEEYKTFFRSTNPFSINSFDRLILRLLGKQISGYGAPSESLSGTMSGNTNSERKEEKVKKTVNIEYDPTIVHTSRNSGRISQHETGRVAGFVSCASCDGMNHVSNSVCVHCGAVQREKTPSEQAYWPVGLVSEYGAVPPGNNSGRTAIPTLISVRTKESCAIRKPIFTIGGKESGCDLIVNNPYISRNHADILMRNGKCYIVDKNSKNKTYVNGEVLPAGKEVEIVSGTQIRLANEDFYFQ